MLAPEIKLELHRLIPHMPHCKRLKDDQEECNCSHNQTVKEIDTFIFQLLRGIK